MSYDKRTHSENRCIETVKKQSKVSRSHLFNKFDVICRNGCEYCSADAFDVRDLVSNCSDRRISCSIDPREPVLNGNEAELYVEKIVDFHSKGSDRSSVLFKGMN